MFTTRKVTRVAAALLASTVLLAGCGGGAKAPATSANSAGGGEKQVSIVFWSAPNPTQEKFWRSMADAYMKEHPNVKIDVAPIPESPSSEAGIMTAISSGTKLTMSENIFVGFGSQLVNSQAVVPLDTMPGFDDLIKSRKAEDLVKGWKFPDGHQYILPEYVNPMMFSWRMDLLKQAGVDKPPRTYSEVIAAGEKLKAKFPDKYLMARKELLNAQNWWERWFDFFTLYYAASDGAPFLTGKQVTANKEIATGVLKFFQNLNNKKLLLTQEANDPFETGLSAWSVQGPWTLPNWKEKFPELKIGENIIFTAPPVPDNFPADKTPKTFADAKGLVIYKNASPDEQKAAWDFAKWVLSDPKHDAQWLDMTGLPPARGDLTTNDAFKPYFDKNPAMKAYAAAVPTGVPPIFSEKFVELQTQMGEQMMIPVLQNTKTPDKAFDDVKAGWESMLK